MSTLHIRTATAADLPTIIRFIRELAEYEKLLHQVTLDPDHLAHELFGNAPVAFTLIAEIDSQPAGFLLGFYNFSTFLGRRGIYIEDVYVYPDYRGQRIGYRLLQTVAQKAVAEGCGRVEWQVLDWNQPSIDFYESLHARCKSDWLTYQLTGTALEALAAQS
jgi:GNAT superfamily N-acetyltransferase